MLGLAGLPFLYVNILPSFKGNWITHLYIIAIVWVATLYLSKLFCILSLMPIPDSTIRGVVDSPYRWFTESATLRLNDTVSRRLTVSLVWWVDDSPYHRYGEFSFKKFNSQLSVLVMRGVVFRIRISPGIRSQNWNGSKGSVRDSWGTNFCKNPRKSVSLPCPFKDDVNDWRFISWVDYPEASSLRLHAAGTYAVYINYW